MVATDNAATKEVLIMSPLRPEEILGMLGGIEETQRGFGRGALAGQELMTREQYEDRKRGLEAIVRGEERGDVAELKLLGEEWGIPGVDEEIIPATFEERRRAIEAREFPAGAVPIEEELFEVPEGFEITGYTGAGKPIVRKIKVAKPAKPIRPRKMTEGLRKSLGRIIGDLLSAKKFQPEEGIEIPITTRREAMDYIMTVYGISPKTHPAEWKKYIQPIINAYVDEPIPKLRWKGKTKEKEIYRKDVLMPKLDVIRPQFERILKEEIAPKIRATETESGLRSQAIAELQKAGAPVTEANIKAAIKQLR